VSGILTGSAAALEAKNEREVKEYQERGGRGATDETRMQHGSAKRERERPVPDLFLSFLGFLLLSPFC
jgi:hypothetical protein